MTHSIFNRRNTLIFVGLITFWRIYLSATLQLHPDEAYYWMWSRHLAAGYFDHPPMVAFFIWVTTLFSLSEFWVRFSGIVVSLALSALAWVMGKQLFKDETVASGSVVLLNIYPLTMAGSIIITPDVPAFLFWALSVFVFWQIVRTQKPAYWYLLGLTFGCALVSKYTTVLLGPSLLLFLLFTEERRWLKTAYPYIASGIAFLCFLPVILWNMSHDWISFRFQLGHGLGGESYSLSRLLEFIGSQLMVTSPIVWLCGIVVVTGYLLSKDKTRRFIAFTAIPTILFFAYSSLKKHGEANWPALAYFSFTFAVSGYFLQEGKARRAAWYAMFVTCFLISFLVTLHARFGVIPLEKYSLNLARTDATNWLYGYRELGEFLSKDYPDARFIMTPSHQLSAEIRYYTKDAFKTIIDERITRPSQYNLFNKPKGLEGARGLYVYAEGDAVSEYKEYFQETGEAKVLTIMRKGIAIRTYHIIPGQGYRPFDESR